MLLRIKCLGCETILKDGKEFQEHCMAVEHDEDFAFDCEEVEIVEMVENPTDE